MAGGGYPAAYRNASRPLRMPSLPPLSSAANAARVPGTFGAMPAANSNVARGYASSAARALPIAGRLLPLIGYGLLLYELWKLSQQFADQLRQAGDETLAGWSHTLHCPENYTHVCNVTGVPDGSTYYAAGSAAWHCGLRCQTHRTPILPPFTGRLIVSRWARADQPVFKRANLVEQWTRASADIGSDVPSRPWRVPDVLFQPSPLPLPGVMPQVLPEAAPAPGTPVPDPVPVPWAFVPWLPTESPTRVPIRGPSRPVRPRPNPYRYPRPRPTETPAEREERRRRAREREEKRRRRGPRPPRPTRPPRVEPQRPPLYIPFPEVPPLEEEETGALPGPGRDVYPEPGLAPELVPSSRLELRPGFKPRVSRTPHRRQRPGRRTRERKVILSWGNHLVFARGVNAATEFCDFVDAIYQSLSQRTRDRIEADRPQVPDWFYRSGGMNLPCHEKAWAVFWNLQHADLNEAIKNLIANQIIDFVFGRAGKAAGEVGRAIGSPVGLATGPAL